MQAASREPALGTASKGRASHFGIEPLCFSDESLLKALLFLLCFLSPVVRARSLSDFSPNQHRVGLGTGKAPQHRGRVLTLLALR